MMKIYHSTTNNWLIGIFNFHINWLNENFFRIGIFNFHINWLNENFFRSCYPAIRLYGSSLVEQNRAEQNRTEQNRTEQNNRTKQNRTEWNGTEQNRTITLIFSWTNEQNRTKQLFRSPGLVINVDTRTTRCPSAGHGSNLL